MAGVNVIAADTEAAAHAQLERTRRARVRSLFGRDDRRLTDDEVEAILARRKARHVEQMLTYTRGRRHPPPSSPTSTSSDSDTGADELIVVHHASTVEQRLRSVELLAKA